ncbi:MAG: hypothetical protein MK135_14445 [Polyangiaceae bacterium]|nr:hypothetical protein [Polyangiaceae bacterium]
MGKQMKKHPDLLANSRMSCRDFSKRRYAQAFRYFCPIAALSWLTFTSPTAYAGNDEGIPVGSEASLVAAAVTATTADGSAGYYNPAGLAHMQRNTLDVTADVYGFRLVSSEGALSHSTGSAAANGVDWVLIPSAATYTRRFGKVVGSFGIFVPKTTDVLLRTTLYIENGPTWIATQREEATDTFYTLSAAWHLSPTVRFGFSAMGVYTAEVTSVQFSGGQEGANNEFISLSDLSNTSEYGLAFMAGIQVDLKHDLTFGASVRSPSLSLYRISQTTTISSTALVDAGNLTSNYDQEDSSEKGFVADVATPPKFRFGLAWQKEPWSVMLDADATPSLDRSFLSPRNWLINFKLGAKYRLSQTFSLGGGLFSDRSASVDRPVNFYGLTLGALYRHELEHDSKSPVTFGTTVAGRYAYGSGTGAGIEVPNLDPQEEILEIDSRTRIHELSLVLGGAVYF